MVITETRLRKNVIADEEGEGLQLQGLLVEKSLEVEHRRFYVLSAAHGHTGGCPGYALLASHRNATKTT